MEIREKHLLENRENTLNLIFMKRSDFIHTSLLGALSASEIIDRKSVESRPPAPRQFNLLYAPHDGMFAVSAGKDFPDQIRFLHDQGFKAIEDNGMLKRPPYEQQRIGDLLEKLEMKMGVFVVDGGDNWKISLTTGKLEFTDLFLKTCRESVEAAKRCRATWLTVVPGFIDRNIPLGIQTAHVIEAMKKGAEIFEPHKLVMVIETLSDTPELFLQHTDHTYSICKAVNSPACKILYDIYHMQRNEGNVITTIDRCYDEIGYFQIGDVPGRKEPGTGEINYKNIFKYLHSKNYTGVLGMEHGNSGNGKAGEMSLINTYRDVDSFE